MKNRRAIHRADWVLVQTGKGLGDNGIWRSGKLNGILYLPDVGSKTTSFCSAFAGIFAPTILSAPEPPLGELAAT